MRPEPEEGGTTNEIVTTTHPNPTQSILTTITLKHKGKKYTNVKLM